MFTAFVSHIGVAVLTAVLSFLSPATGSTVPECTHEDGSTQAVCVVSYVTQSGESRVLVNKDYGATTYYPATDTTIEWDTHPSAELVRFASQR